MLRFSIAESIIFGLIDGASEDLKIIRWVIENLRIPSDTARRGVLGTEIGTLGTGSWANLC